jgi:hypothetical protein
MKYPPQSPLISKFMIQIKESNSCHSVVPTKKPEPATVRASQEVE